MGLVKTIVTYGRDGTPTYMIGDRTVTREEFDAIMPSKPIGVPLDAHRPDCWPMISEAMGVQPEQVSEAASHARSNGVPTDFTPDGRVIVRDRKHRRELLRLYGMHDNQGGYGD